MPIFNCCFIFPKEKYAGTKLFDFFCLFLVKPKLEEHNKMNIQKIARG